MRAQTITHVSIGNNFAFERAWSKSLQTFTIAEMFDFVTDYGLSVWTDFGFLHDAPGIRKISGGIVTEKFVIVDIMKQGN